MRRELKELEIEQERLECQPDGPTKASLLSKVRMKLSTTELRLQQLEEELQDVKPTLGSKDNEGRLECSVAYAGTELRFGEEMLRLQREERQCIAKMICGEIVVM